MVTLSLKKEQDILSSIAQNDTACVTESIPTILWAWMHAGGTKPY